MNSGQSFSAPSPSRAASDAATAEKWSALHRAAGAVAALAGIDPELSAAESDEFPKAVAAAGGWRKALAEQGIDDIVAIMAPGIAALLAIHARGTSSPAAARALWHEFLHARTALLALASPAMPGTHRLT